MKQGKFWGTTTPIIQTGTVQAHYLEIKPGGYCSEHRHVYRRNFFFVISGSLRVLTWMQPDDKEPDIIEIGPGESTFVPSGLWHKFEADEGCRAVEFYLLPLNDETDIERRTRGGLGQESKICFEKGIKGKWRPSFPTGLKKKAKR